MNINVENLSIKYDGHLLFEDVSFDVPSGRVCCISGPSGCGKSSLLGAMLGFVSPERGTITIDGTAVGEKSAWQLRHNISYVTQEPDFGRLTALECIQRPFAYKANAHLQWNIDTVKSHFKQFNLPEKLLNKSVTDLSGGEKQRIAIIIALLLERPILLLDEPTSALDKENRRVLKEVLAGLDKTILFVSHDEVLLDLADMTVDLKPAGVYSHE